ncbi:MAG: hypothetical protein Kow00129_15310 [Thermoleophilia bacterium]
MEELVEEKVSAEAPAERTASGQGAGDTGPPTLREVSGVWWPLAASWLLMGFEGPALAAIVARLADPEIHLAAFGGIVFPLALMVEAPIIMLLAASTALTRDRESYRRLYRFTTVAGALLTLVHVAIAVTPLFDLVVGRLMSPPEEVLAPARLGLIVMIPWTWAIADRRFHQGVLIRFGRSRAVGAGSAVRLLADGTVLAAGYLIGSLPGILVASSAVIAGVLIEAAYVRMRVAPVLREELPVQEHLGTAGAGAGPPGLRSFLAFYVPLSLTSVLSLLVQPVGAAALSRMPLALESLAVWPVVIGLVFVFRSFGFAYNEVVVALVDRPGAEPVLRRFTRILAFATLAAFALFLVPVVAELWFVRVTGLGDSLAGLAALGLWLALPMPALSVFMSWYQGLILFSRRTRAVSEAVAISLLTTSLVLLAGVVWGRFTGLYAGVAAITLGEILRIGWLWFRSAPVRRYFREAEGLRRSEGLREPAG